MTLAPALLPRFPSATRTLRTPPVPGIRAPHSGSAATVRTTSARSWSSRTPLLSDRYPGISTTVFHGLDTDLDYVNGALPATRTIRHWRSRPAVASPATGRGERFEGLNDASPFAGVLATPPI